MNIKDQTNAIRKINERELLLREDNQIESKKYIDYLHSVKQFKQELIDKKVAAKEEIKKMKNQIAELNTEFLKEKDPNKQKIISEKKLELRRRIEDADDLIHTNISNIVKDKYLKETIERNGYEQRCSKEYLEFKQEVSKHREYYLELQKEIQIKLNDIYIVEQAHTYKRLEEAKNEIKRMDYLQDDGWVGDGKKIQWQTNTILYAGREDREES